MSAETGSIGMEAMSFSAPAVEAIASPAEITSPVISTPPLIDISSQIHPYAGVGEEPASLIDKSTFEDFPKAFETFFDEKSAFPPAEPGLINIDLPVSPFSQIGQPSVGIPEISSIQTEIPSVFHETSLEPSIETIMSSELEETPTINDLQNAVFEPHFDIPFASSSHADFELTNQTVEAFNDTVNVQGVSAQAETEIEPAILGFIETKTETQAETETLTEASSRSQFSAGIETTSEAPFPTENEGFSPPPASEDLYVIDESANSERMNRVKSAINEVFDEDPEEVVGTQVTSILGDTPELDEISGMIKDQTQTIEDGSYKEVIDDLAEEKFESRDDALEKTRKLLRKKPAVTISPYGIPVTDEDIERVVRKGKPRRESVVFEGK